MSKNSTCIKFVKMPYLRIPSLDSNQELSSVLQRNFLMRWAF